jgi:hypothetical protein
VRAGRRKDAGFDRRVFADDLGRRRSSFGRGLAELGMGPTAVAALRASTAGWRGQLLDAADMSTTDALQSVGRRMPPV